MSSLHSEYEGATILFLHPVGLDSECWREAAEGLGSRYIDLPGHGGSVGIPVPATMSGLVDFVLTGIDTPVHLIGASLGAFISLQAAIERPDLVRSAVVIAGAAALDGETMRQRAGTLRLSGTASSIDTTMSRWFSREALDAGGHPGIEYARERLSANPVEPIAATWEAMATYDVTDRLPGVSVPISCVYAASDVSTPPVAAKKVSGLLQHSRLDELEGPHMVLLESPKAVRDAIVRHFDWLSRKVAANGGKLGQPGASNV